MLTFQNYLAQKQSFDEQMRQTRFEESSKVKALEEERRQQNSNLFDQFIEAKRKNNQEYSDKILEARQEFIARRRKIFEDSNLLTIEWRRQLLKLESGEITNEQIYENTPPYCRIKIGVKYEHYQFEARGRRAA